MAAATAPAAAAASAGWTGGFCGAAGYRGTEDGELDGGFLAGTLRAGDFLLAVDDDFFELRSAIVADVFVDGHTRFLFVDVVIIAIFSLVGERLETTERLNAEVTFDKTQRTRRGPGRTKGSGEIEAAVGIDGLAGDEAALGEENRDTGNFIDGAEGTYGKAVGRESRKRSDHVGFDQRWSDGVDGDSLFSKEVSIRACEAEDSCFGCRIVRAHDTAILRRNRRQIDDAAPASATHGRKSALGDEKDGS